MEMEQSTWQHSAKSSRFDVVARISRGARIEIAQRLRLRPA
jgi:hypothetical protein